MAEQRNALLAEMTDEVARLVLRDNYEQNVLLGNARVQAPGDALRARAVHQRARGARRARPGAGVPAVAGRDRAAAEPPGSG